MHPFSSAAAWKQISLLNYAWITQFKMTHISMQTWKTCKHTQAHRQLYICGKSQSFLLTLVNTWHRDRSTSVHQWSFSLRWRETSYAYVDAVCMETHSQGKPLTCSHAPALCKCQTVRERVYLGAVWYFYTFRAAALSLSHTHTHTHWVFHHCPFKGKPWPSPPHWAWHENTKSTLVLTQTSMLWKIFHFFTKFDQTSRWSQCNK